MITVIDSIRAVSALVEGLFGEPPTTKDIHEDFIRPCTYVQAVSMETDDAGDLALDTYGLEIIRLAKRAESGYLELLEYQAALRKALSAPIPVDEGFSLYPEDVEFDINRRDMALVASFTVTNAQLRPDDGEEALMGGIQLTRKD